MITMSMIQELQKRLNVIRGRVDALKKNCEDYKLGMDNCDRLVVEMENATNVLFNFNIWLNERTKTRLEGITNEALSLIFPDKTMKFHVTPNQTKKGVSYELSIETDGVMTDLLDAKGCCLMSRSRTWILKELVPLWNGLSEPLICSESSCLSLHIYQQ